MADPGGNSKLLALQSYVDLAKLEITLATGTVVFSGTFLKDLLGASIRSAGPPFQVLFLSWGLLVLSIVVGLFFVGRSVTLLASDNVKADDAWLDWFGRAQQGAFLFGLVLFGIFAWASASTGNAVPGPAPGPSPTP
jgi:hypothetical protein